jgi:hypothetical protein
MSHSHSRLTYCNLPTCDKCHKCEEEVSHVLCCEAVACNAAVCNQCHGTAGWSYDMKDELHFCDLHAQLAADFNDAGPISPGIINTVNWLRANGFETTDSGDGKTNLEAGMSCAWDVPMVAMEIPPYLFLDEANRLQRLIDPFKNDGRWELDPQVEVAYLPKSGVCSLLLTCFDDAILAQKDKVDDPV